MCGAVWCGQTSRLSGEAIEAMSRVPVGSDNDGGGGEETEATAERCGVVRVCICARDGWGLVSGGLVWSDDGHRSLALCGRCWQLGRSRVCTREEELHRWTGGEGKSGL